MGRTTSIPPGLRFAVLERDKFRCFYCGRGPAEAPLQVDRFVPRAKNGTDDYCNLVTACFECNIGKSDRVVSDDERRRLRAHVRAAAIERNAQLLQAFPSILADCAVTDLKYGDGWTIATYGGILPDPFWPRDNGWMSHAQEICDQIAGRQAHIGERS